MPTIEENSSLWGGNYDWPDSGDEWSIAWGGPRPQWFGALLPRIQAFLPVSTILEIAPGFGRWTQFLKNHCRRLIVVDLNERCIETCKKRFADVPHIEYHVNDGKSLQFLEDGSVDFVFSFDSLVHAEADVIEEYLQQLASKLSANGAGFIHHSNLGSLLETQALPSGFENVHWRAKTVSAKLFEERAAKAGIRCIAQEKVNWGGAELTDTFSLFTPTGSRWSRTNQVLENPQFMSEAASISRLAQLYTREIR